MDFKDYRNNLEGSVEKERHRLTPYKEYIDLILTYVQGRCLEVGCGDGIWSRILKDNCARLVCLDLSQERVRFTRQNMAGPGADFIVSDARKMPFKDASFNTIVALEIIEHLPSRKEHDIFLGEIKRLLKTGGVLLISTPNKPLFRIYCKIAREAYPTHFSELNYFQFRLVLKRSFSSIKIYGRLGWLSLFYQYRIVRQAHNLLSKATPLCKGLLGVCRKV